MKKILMLFLGLLSVIVFAQDFSMAKYQSLKKTSLSEARKYSYQADVSSQSDYLHIAQSYRYLSANNQFNKQTRDALIQKFNSSKILAKNKNGIEGLFGIMYARTEDFDKAIEFAKKTNRTDIYQIILKNYQDKKDFQNLWKYSVEFLTQTGGFNRPVRANRILTTMFRYKPSTVTKEQQIEFLQKLSQIYPIPGTDFSKWKSFMGFVGYKYKALTGKDLFPESK